MAPVASNLRACGAAVAHGAAGAEGRSFSEGIGQAVQSRWRWAGWLCSTEKGSSLSRPTIKIVSGQGCTTSQCQATQDATTRLFAVTSRSKYNRATTESRARPESERSWPPRAPLGPVPVCPGRRFGACCPPSSAACCTRCTRIPEPPRACDAPYASRTPHLCTFCTSAAPRWAQLGAEAEAQLPRLNQQGLYRACQAGPSRI